MLTNFRLACVAFYLAGAIGSAVSFYSHFCGDDPKSWSDVPTAMFGGLFWPFMLSARVGMLAFDPQMATAQWGCSPKTSE